MSVKNPLHIDAGRVIIVTTKGLRISATVLDNDKQERCLHLETLEGCFETLPYTEFSRAFVPRPAVFGKSPLFP